MMKKPKIKISNIIFAIIILLLLIPQTRQPIQLFFHKGLARISPSTISDSDQEKLINYNWNLVDQNGEQFNLEHSKGKVVFINFWATWCPPCIAEMPSIDALYKDYNDKIVFLLVSDEPKEVIKAFNDKNNFSFNFYNSVSPAPSSFKTRSIPRTFIVDKSGNIVMDKGGAANWNSETVRTTLDKLLSE